MDEFLLELQAKLDEAKSKGNINADIEKIQQQVDKLKLQAEIDPKSISNLVKQLESVLNQKITISNIGLNQQQIIKDSQQTGRQIAQAINQGVSQGTSFASSATNKILRDFNELNDAKRKFVDGSDLISKEDIADANRFYETVKQAFSEFGQVTVNGKLTDGNLENLRVKIQQVNGELKTTREFMLYLNKSDQFENSFVLADDDTIKTSERLIQHLNERKNIVNATGDEIERQKQQLADQEKYYKNLKNEVNNLYSLQTRLLSADELQTAELEKQIKQTKERIRYNNQQIDKKDLRSDNLDREINDLEVAKQKQLALASAKTQDTINTKELTRAEKETTAAIKERQAVESQVNKILLSMSGNGKVDYNWQVDDQIKKLRDLGFTDEEVAKKVEVLTNAHIELQRVINSNEFDSIESQNRAIIESDNQRTIALNQVKNAYKELKIDASQYYNLNKQTKLSTDIQNWLSKNTRASKEAKESLTEYYRELSNGRVSVDRLKYIESELKKIDAEQRGLGKLGKSLKDQITQAKDSFVQWLSVSSAVMALVYQLKRIPEEVKEVNASMVELRKVSDASAKEITNYFDEAADSAKNLGSSVSDLINATADWSRLGYSLPDSKKLAEIATLYKNVGDGIDINAANESLISTLQGFQLEAEDAMSIIDKFNEVANNFPIDSGGIGEALQRSAASFYAANTDLSKSIALITATNSVVQNPEVVGTMWKTVSMRIRGAVSELEEAGLETEGMVETTSELRDLIKGMTGFDIMKDEKTFKDIYDIVVGIGKEWKNLTDIEQASLLEKLAGKRQGNALSAALNNISMIEDAYKTAENSAGSALREQEEYEKGIQYSLDRLEASFQEFSNHILDSDFLKGIIDFGNGTINVLDAITSKLGTLGTLGAGAGLFAGIKNVGMANYISSPSITCCLNMPTV